MAAQNRNPCYQGFVGDEERMFRRVGVAAEGLWSKLRRISHDADVPGLLIDHTLRPLDPEDLADMVHLRPGEFRSHMRELRDRQIVQTIGEYRAGLAVGARANGTSRAMLAVFDNLVAPVRQCLQEAAAEVLLIPPMVTLHLRYLVGRSTGSTSSRAKSKVVAFAAEGAGGDADPYTGGYTPPYTPPYTSPVEAPVPDPRIGRPAPQNQESKSESESKSGNRKRKTAAAGAREPEFELRGQPGGAPWSWEKHLWLCDQVRKLDLELKAQHPESLEDPQLYASHFFGRFQFEHSVFASAQEFYQHGPASQPVPQPCVDGHHVPDPVTGRCSYCSGPINDDDGGIQ